MTIALTPEQYATLQSKLATAPGITVSVESPTQGSVSQHDIDFTYNYNGSTSLDIEVTQKKSFLARHASDSMIDSHIQNTVEENL